MSTKQFLYSLLQPGAALPKLYTVPEMDGRQTVLFAIVTSFLECNAEPTDTRIANVWASLGFDPILLAELLEWVRS